MTPFRTLMGNRSGQALIMAIAIGLVLLVALTIVVSMNQIGTRHQTASAQAGKSMSVAEEGLAYATQELSASSMTWKNALMGLFPTDCNGPALASASGSLFKLYCSVSSVDNARLQSYQVAVTAVALGPANGGGTPTPIRARRAYLSRRTLGADLANGLHAAAALQVAAAPAVAGALNVHWGPMVCLDNNNLTNVPWSLSDPLDSQRYPRKFSVGGITGVSGTFPRSGTAVTPGPKTDVKEYWAFAPISPTPQIDDVTYKQLAQSETGIVPPLSRNSIRDGAPVAIAATGCIGAGNTTCGYFVTSGDTAVFGSGGLYTLTNGPVIYVEGYTEFDQIAIDSATFIVKGPLTVTDSTGGTQPLALPVPWATAPSEYPYSPATQPCQNAQTCAYDVVFTGNVQFRGFLNVEGNMTVQTTNWNMAGVLLVGTTQSPPGTSGQLIIPFGDSLTLAYDDQINHSILVSPIAGTAIKLVTDFIQDVAAY